MLAESEKLYRLGLCSPASAYQSRRAKLAKSLSKPLLIPAGFAPARNYAANPFPFRAQSTYLYFGGPAVEGATLLIEAGSDGSTGCRLYRPAVTAADEVWEGPAAADAALAAAAGLPLAAIRPSGQLENDLRNLTASYIDLPCYRTSKWLAKQKLTAATAQELEPIVTMRLFKDEHEMTAMRRAAEVSTQAQKAAWRVARAGRHEREVVAAFNQTLWRHGCRASFNPIITIRGETLHLRGYYNELQEGDLLLLDAAGEEPGAYASDMTRVIPVSGRFTGLQKDLHDTVHRAMTASIAACQPGKRFRDIHFMAARILTEGLVAAGLLKGDPAKLVERGAHALFFPHGLGHLIGLDVHDMEDYGDIAGYPPGRTRSKDFGTCYLRLDRDLAPGMCLTIEPGIYFIPAVWKSAEISGSFADVVNRPLVDKLLEQRFGGIRLEESVHVRKPEAGGPEALTAGLVSRSEEVLALLNEPGFHA